MKKYFFKTRVTILSETYFKYVTYLERINIFFMKIVKNRFCKQKGRQFTKLVIWWRLTG